MHYQPTFAEAECDSRKKTTRRAEFLDAMDSVVPWDELVGLIEPHRPAPGGRGRQPWPTETLLRMHLLQCWFTLSDEAAEDLLYDSLSARSFARVSDGVPDATTLLHFRHLLLEEGLDDAVFDAIRDRLERAGLSMRGGSMVDATIIDAPSSTKNASGERDPEMHQTAKGNQWYFGMKAHIGAGSADGYVHTATFTPANTADICELHSLVRRDDRVCYVDNGYKGAEKRPEIAGDPALSRIDFRVAKRKGELAAMEAADPVGREEERRKASVRSHVEHPFQIVKRVFGFVKCHYRGIAKNASRLKILFASANLLMVHRSGRTAEFLAA